MQTVHKNFDGDRSHIVKLQVLLDGYDRPVSEYSHHLQQAYTDRISVTTPRQVKRVFSVSTY